MIELVNVEKTYYSKAGDIHALHKTSLSIKAGEIFGIIGLSGAGKSTLVRHQHAGKTDRRSGFRRRSGADRNERKAAAQGTPKHRHDFPAL